MSNISLSTITLQENWTRLMIAVFSIAALLGVAIALCALFVMET